MEINQKNYKFIKDFDHIDHHDEREMFSSLYSGLEYEFLNIGNEIKDDYKTKDARKNFEEDNSLDNLKALAKQLNYQLRYRSATPLYEKIVELEPDNVLMHKKLALCYLKTRKYDKAIKEYTLLSDLDDDPIDGPYHLLLAHHYSHRYDEAIKEANKCYPHLKENGEMLIAVLYWDIASRIKNNQNIQDLQAFYQDDLDVGHHKGYNIAVREAFGLISHEEATTIVNLYDALNQSCYYYLAYLLLKKDNNQFASALLYENFLTPQWWAGFSFLAALEEMKELDIDIISIKNKYEKYAGRIFKDKNADRRQEKTLNVVYNAFTYLLKRKKYSDISINDILLESNVSRSTFYSYFKKKEDLLESICNLIFDHVFSHDLSKEKSHSFTDDHDKVHIITHILYHFLDERDLFDAISINESKYIFEQYLKERYMDTAKRALDSHLIKRKDVPEELQLQEIINNFILVLEYWQNSNYQESPENVTTYYLKICS